MVSQWCRPANLPNTNVSAQWSCQPPGCCLCTLSSRPLRPPLPVQPCHGPCLVRPTGASSALRIGCPACHCGRFPLPCALTSLLAIACAAALTEDMNFPPDVNCPPYGVAAERECAPRAVLTASRPSLHGSVPPFPAHSVGSSRWKVLHQAFPWMEE